MGKKIYIPTANSESWKKLLAEPNKHWKSGYSAMAMADIWEKTGDSLPSEIRTALDNEPDLKNSEFLFALPEFQVPLPGGTRPSQNDLLLFARNDQGLSVVAVEGKGKEDFDKLVSEWFMEASAGKKERLNYLMETIQISDMKEIMNIRYQLLHRLASAIIMAKKFHAKNAIMLIQSFIENDEVNHYKDFVRFVKAYNLFPQKGIPIPLIHQDNMNVYALWVNSKML